jgi:tetratricopeptide (TPR) repeat protein
LRVLDTVCIDAPDRMDAHLLRAKIAGSALSWARAEESVSRALTLAPEDADALGVAARIAFAREHYEDALRQANLALSKNPNDVESALVSAHSLLKLRRSREAVALLDPLARRIPGPRLLAALGEALLDVGSPEEAERVLTVALERRAASTALALRGRAFAAQARWQPAKEDLIAAIDRDPNDPAPYDDLSVVLTSGFEGEAVDEWRARGKGARLQRDELLRLRDAFATNPRDGATADALVEVLRQAGLDEEAARVVDRARSREMDPCGD